MRLTPVRFDLRSSFIYWWHLEKLYLLKMNPGFQQLSENISQFTLNEPRGKAQSTLCFCHTSPLVKVYSSRLPPPSIHCIYGFCIHPLICLSPKRSELYTHWSGHMYIRMILIAKLCTVGLATYHTSFYSVNSSLSHGFGSVGKESVCNAGDLGSIPGSGTSSG